MVRASLCPLADAQQMCSVWLEKYFDTYGDKSPNSNIIHVHVLQKSDVYDMYRRQMENTHEEIVADTVFNSLWNTLFPNCQNRTWCDIPGKCNTCYEIDRLRRTSEDSIVQEKLQEAHLIHRGGMIMPERNE